MDAGITRTGCDRGTGRVCGVSRLAETPRVRKQGSDDMWDWTSLWARGRGQPQQRPESAISHIDALRNNETPPNRNGQGGPGGPGGPNGTRPQQPRNNGGANTGLGWITRLLFIALLLIVGYRSEEH